MKESFAVYEIPHRVFMSAGEYINEYKVLSTLGEGTFGIVYKVENDKGGVKALKLIKLWEVTPEKERKAIITRFIREFEIATLHSPYLVKSFSYGKLMGNPYVVMEYCEGGSLENWVGRFNKNANYDRIAYHILKGLHEMHSSGYFHRDIKPANILLTAGNEAKLTDFGIAGHKTSRLTRTNILGKVDRIFGTWAYIAPEQENNSLAFKALDAVTDIFSFGVTMFELFTGEYPFPPYKITSESDNAEYRENVRKGNWKNLELKRNLVPLPWISIIEGCLHPDYHKKRFRTINEIILRLGYKSIDFGRAATHSDKLALQVTYGEEPRKTYNLDELLNNAEEGILTIGRKDVSVTNHIEIKENESTYISRRHATIEKWAEPKCWIIRDGQWVKDEWTCSVNGLFVNSIKVSKTGLQFFAGDVITIGDTVLKIISV